MSRFSLSEVKELVEAYLAGQDTLWFSAKSRSVAYVVNVLLCTEGQAEEFILKGIMKLNPTDFARTVVLKWGAVADEYGLESYLGHNWYVKFSVDDEDGARIVNELSFHPIEQALRLVDARLLPVTYGGKSR